MPALYRFPPHPLCPHIPFKQVGPCYEDERPLWPFPSQNEPLPSARGEKTRTSPLPIREDPTQNSVAPGATHLEGATRTSNGHTSVSFDKPYKETRRSRDAAAQRELDALELKIPYSMAMVPECTITNSGMHGSILCPAFKREIWEAATGELLHLTHEAAERRSEKTGAFHGIFHEHAEAERLSLDFIQDRMATDDPIRGYLIRTNDDERYLQGFIWYTTFTSWTHFFRWDSLAPEAGLTNSAEKYPVRWDHDGLLAGELELQFRSGDPRGEGVIWPKVAEISLMGALGCGELLMQLVLEEMEAAHTFDYAVVQATESSASFYDKMGFIRVGAIAKYIKPGEERQAAVIAPAAYRHFVGPDQDVKDIDPSIMMAIRLRAGHVPRRLMATKGGVFTNLGRDVPVGLSAAALDPDTVQKLLSSDISGSDIEAKVVGDTLVLGPGASDFSLRLLAEHMGGEQWERAKAVLCEAPEHKDEIARPGRASSEIARRKMNLWLSPTAHRPWTCYGTIPEATSEEGCGKRSARGNARRGRGQRVIRSRAMPSPRVKGLASPGTFSGEETPRRRKPAALDLYECIDGKRHAVRTSRSPASSHMSHGDGISPVPAMDRDAASPTGGISRLRKETVREICIHLNIPITRKLPFVKLNATKSKQQLITSLMKLSKDSPIAWIHSDTISLETLQNICVDLNLPSDGSEEELRNALRQQLSDNLGEYLPSPAGASDNALHGDKKSFKKRMTPESGSKRTDKADDVLVALTQGKNGENKQSEELCLWDLIKCEACGSGEFEERIILCDGCDAAYHLECMTPALDQVPEGEWYCVSCEEKRRKVETMDAEADERQRKAQEMREERNRKDRERRAREKKQREEEEEREQRQRDDRDQSDREKQQEREERQRQAREQRDKRLEEERLAKERERERKLQKERDRKAKEQREREEREREERDEREQKLKDKEQEREKKMKMLSEKDVQRTLEKAQKEAQKEGKREKEADAKTPRGAGEGRKDKDRDKEADVKSPRAGKMSPTAAALIADFADWDMMGDDEGKSAWNQKLKHTWYGGPGMEWVTKETLRCLCQELDLPINRKLPCTKIHVAKSKQQLIGTLERRTEAHAFSWVEHEDVTEDTLRAVCADLCINSRGDEQALRTRIRAVLDNPDVYVQRMFIMQGDDATLAMSGNAWDQIECEKCGSAKDEERMVLCDMCDAGYHIDCLEPKLKAIPEGEWICKVCVYYLKWMSRELVCTYCPMNLLMMARLRLALLPSPLSLQDCRKSKQKKKRPKTEEDTVGVSPGAAATAKEDGKEFKKRRPSMEGKSPKAGGVTEVGDKAGRMASTPWDLVECQKCGSAEDEERMILCDVCDAGYHLYCAEPKLKKVPEGDWICQDCAASKTSKKRRRAPGAAGGGGAGSSSSKGDGIGSGGKDDALIVDKEDGRETPWDEVKCGKCQSTQDEEHMVLCDMCDAGFHLDCAEPKLKKIPGGDWICKDCRKSKKQKRSAQPDEEGMGKSPEVKLEDGKGVRKCPQGEAGSEDALAMHASTSHAASNDGTEATNPWDLIECQHCGSAEGEERMILCDMCDGGFHLECTEPRLEAIPVGEWICKYCTRERKRAQSKKEQEKKYKEFQERVNGSALPVGQSKVSGRQIVVKQPYKVPR